MNILVNVSRDARLCPWFKCRHSNMSAILAQLKEFYKDTWENILDCCDTMILIGSNTKETNEYFSTILGKKTWYKKSSGRTFSRQGSSSQNWDVVGRELATIDELAKIEKGHCVMFIANVGELFTRHCMI